MQRSRFYLKIVNRMIKLLINRLQWYKLVSSFLFATVSEESVNICTTDVVEHC
jgi:hypothetical protein